MGFEQNALTIASHTVMVLSLLALILRAISTFHKGLGGIAVERGLLTAVSICALALIIERSFYIVARAVHSSGINLWALHPAPEVLSLVVGIGFYGIMVPMIRVACLTAARARTLITIEVTMLVSIWLLIAWFLY